MNKALIATIAVVIVALTGGLIYLAQREDTPAIEDALMPTQEERDTDGTTEPEASDEATAAHTVVFTDGVFTPAELRISAGETVVFRNEGSSTIHIASDPHPTHTAYPEFDSRRGIAPGAEYSFTFERSGSWGYHNHLNPNQTGTVIVE